MKRTKSKAPIKRAKQKAASSELAHLDRRGHVHMVDVGDKPATLRRAVATARVFASPSALAHLRDGSAKKGDVLAVTRVAAIQGTKNAASWIPLCHPIALTHAACAIEVGADRIDVRVTVETRGPTGVEMEALAGASAAALTLYDMLKSVDREMRFEVMLAEKSGGRSGTFEGS